MRHLQKSGIITLKALGSPIGSRTAQVQEQQLEETKFIAFFMGKKIDIEGKDLNDAKQKAITQLKVPKSKVGLLAVVSAESQRNQDFKFENVNEEVVNEVKVIDIVDRFENLKLPNIVYLNKKPFTGKTFVMNGYNGYKSSDTDGLFYDINTKKPLTDKQGNILRATTHRGAKFDFKDGIRESVNEGNKVFKVNPPIGKAKYSISSHNGTSTHNDGSDFYDIKIFKNKVDLEKGIKDYKSKGFVEEGVNEENPGLWANIKAKQARGEAPSPKNSKAYKDAVEAGDKIKNQQSIKREALKSIVREVMKEESEYQKFFQKVLDKAGKSIPSMSDDEKKAFFNKVDAAWNGRGEKNESVMKEGIWPKSKLSGQFQMQLSLQLKKNFKGVFYSVGYDLYHNDKKILKIDGNEDSINSVVAKLKSKIRK